MFKKLNVVLSGLFIVILLTGCERYVQSNHGSIAVAGYEEGKIAYKIAESIYNRKIQEGENSLKELFSQYSEDFTEDFEGQLEAFNSVLGVCESYEGVVVSELSNNYGTKEELYNIELKFYLSDGTVLRVSIIYCYRNDLDKEREGIQSLGYTKSSDREGGFLFYDGKELGIFEL